ncbi:MAG: 3-keto-disaccharide hydrolase [Flavobacteriaceae bacterium]
MKPEETEVWEPEPKVVQPGVFLSPPSDAIILFDGTDFSKWRSERTKGDVEWTLNPDKSMTVKPGKGGIETIDEHGSVQLHIEWKSPTVIKGEGQGRGNSGIFFQRRYEIQVLDSYQNRTYSNGQAGSIYKQYIPLVNAMRPTGEWQVYDIVFNVPEFNDNGDEIKPGSFIVFHNGILIQNSVEIQGTTEYIGRPKKGRNVMPGFLGGDKHRSLMLQDHSDLVSYRNIWMRKL